jgi:hypothetical protein
MTLTKGTVDKGYQNIRKIQVESIYLVGDYKKVLLKPEGHPPPFFPQALVTTFYTKVVGGGVKGSAPLVNPQSGTTLVTGH